MEAQEQADKKAYQAPRLEVLGTVQDLTQMGPPSFVVDAISGSFSPPGLSIAPGLNGGPGRGR